MMKTRIISLLFLLLPSLLSSSLFSQPTKASIEENVFPSEETRSSVRDLTHQQRWKKCKEMKRYPRISGQSPVHY